MPLTLRTSARDILRMEPVYHGKGKHAHAIRRVGALYRASRMNHQRYGLKSKASADFATKAEALAWCQADYDTVLRPVVTATTTTAGYTQPAVGATVVVAVTSATGLAVGQSVTIATGGKYEITGIAGLNITCKNLFPEPDNAAPATAITTAKAFTVVPGW